MNMSCEKCGKITDMVDPYWKLIQIRRDLQELIHRIDGMLA